jgi:hypothetical protein
MEERQREWTVAMIVVATIFVPLSFVTAYLETRDVRDAALFALGISVLLGFVWSVVAKDLPEIPPRRRRAARTLFWIGGLLGVVSMIAVVWRSPLGTRHGIEFWLGFLLLSLLLVGDALKMPVRRVGWAWVVLFAGTLVWSRRYRTERVNPMLWFWLAWSIVALVHGELKRLSERRDGPDGEKRS